MVRMITCVMCNRDIELSPKKKKKNYVKKAVVDWRLQDIKVKALHLLGVHLSNNREKVKFLVGMGWP